MDVKINQVILHILDAGASEPVLSDRPMELDADLYEYFSVCIEKAFASDDSKNCRFLPDSPFLQEMQHNDDFIDLSRRIAGVIFEQLLQYQGIPSGDLAVVDCAVDGVPFYAVLKLNYRPGFTHVTNVMGNGQCSTIAPQRTLLPGNSKADEAALIDRANLTIRLIEKKVALDDKKDFYLSTKVFACTQAMPEKAKLKAVCETAVAAVQQAYPEPEQLDDVPPLTAAPKPPWSCWYATRRWITPSRWRMCAPAWRSSIPLPYPLLSRRWRIPAWSATTGSRSARPASKSWKAAALRPNPVLRSRSPRNCATATMQWSSSTAQRAGFRC